MPQLDKFTYFTQFFWSCLFLFTFYIPFLLRSKRTTKVCLYLYNFTLFFVVFVRVVHFFSYQLFSYRQGGVCSAARFESAGLASFPRAGRSSSGNTAISYSCWIFSRSRKGGVSNIIDRLTWEEVKEVVDLNSVQLFNIFPGDRNPLQLLSTFPREILSAEQQAALRDRWSVS